MPVDVCRWSRSIKIFMKGSAVERCFYPFFIVLFVFVIIIIDPFLQLLTFFKHGFRQQESAF